MSVPPPPQRPEDIFRSAEDWWHNAVLSGTEAGWFEYLEGYRRAADLLVNQVPAHRHLRDWIVYPIMFLYRHYLELSIKALHQEALDLLGREGKPANIHFHDSLWRECHPLLEEVFREEGDGSFDLSLRLSVIGEGVERFTKIDRDSLGFRYPVDGNGEVRTHPITEVNLRVLMEGVGRVAQAVGEILNLLSIFRDQDSEFAGEWGDGGDFGYP